MISFGYVHANDEHKGIKAVEELENIYNFSESKIEKPDVILGII